MKQVKIESKEQAQNKAIEWQNWANEQNLSYSEVAEWSIYFERLADEFDLNAEFKENGII